MIKRQNVHSTERAHLASYDSLHLFIRRNWCAGQVWVGVADTLRAGQVQAAWAASCSGYGGVLHRHLIGLRTSCSQT